MELLRENDLIGLYFKPVMKCIAALYYYNRYILNYYSILLTILGVYSIHTLSMYTVFVIHTECNPRHNYLPDMSKDWLKHGKYSEK